MFIVYAIMSSSLCSLRLLTHSCNNGTSITLTESTLALSYGERKSRTAFSCLRLALAVFSSPTRLKCFENSSRIFSSPDAPLTTLAALAAGLMPTLMP